MNRRLVHALIALAPAVSACRHTRASDQPASRASQQPVSADYCTVRKQDTLALSEHGFDGLSFDSSLGSLNLQCPAARETTLVGYEGEAVALLLPFHGASLLAYPAGDTLDATQRASLWSIRGDSVRLPHGLMFNSSWADFRSAYGTRGAIAAAAPNNDTEWVVFGFCTLPHLTFEFPLPAAQEIIDHGNGDVSPDDVPPIPHIAHVDLEREPESWLVDHCR